MVHFWNLVHGFVEFTTAAHCWSLGIPATAGQLVHTKRDQCQLQGEKEAWSCSSQVCDQVCWLMLVEFTWAFIVVQVQSLESGAKRYMGLLAHGSWRLFGDFSSVFCPKHFFGPPLHTCLCSRQVAAFLWLLTRPSWKRRAGTSKVRGFPIRILSVGIQKKLFAAKLVCFTSDLVVTNGKSKSLFADVGMHGRISNLTYYSIKRNLVCALDLTQFIASGLGTYARCCRVWSNKLLLFIFFTNNNHLLHIITIDA